MVSGHLFDCNNQEGEGATALEVRDVAKHPIMHRAAPCIRVIRPKLSIVLRLKAPIREVIYRETKDTQDRWLAP